MQTKLPVNVFSIFTVYRCTLKGWSYNSYIANFWYNDSIGFKFPVEVVYGLFNVADSEVCVDHISTVYVHEVNSN